jgi:plastocyanin
MRKLALVISVLALAAVGLAACGDDDETTSASETTPTAADTGGTGGTGGTIAVEADPDGALAYTETELTASAGSNTIDFNNPAGLEHDVVVEDEGGGEIGRTDTVAGGSTSATVELEAGTYTYYCSVDGHRDAGMEGTLTVN